MGRVGQKAIADGHQVRRGRASTFVGLALDRAAAELAVDRGWSATRIRAELARRHGEAVVPDTRTIRRWLGDQGLRAAAGTWRWEAAAPSMAARLLPLVAAMREISGGEVRGLSVDRARAANRLLAIAPDLPPVMTWRLAVEYLVAKDRADRSTLDAIGDYLAHGPWRSEADHGRYLAALRDGRAAVAMTMALAGYAYEAGVAEPPSLPSAG